MGCGSSRDGAVSPRSDRKGGGSPRGVKFILKHGGGKLVSSDSFDTDSVGGESPSFYSRVDSDKLTGTLQMLRPEARSSIATDSPDSRAKARALAERVLPFVPVRVVQAFAEGYLNGAATGAVTPAPEPRRTNAAVLVLDVSGFTKLSEKYSRLGSKGAEAFTLNISSMFARMTSIIRTFQGDVDCFAGDAVLVLFETQQSGRRVSSCKACDDLRSAAQHAVNCAKEVHQQINGFQVRGDDPPLTIHCALAAGAPPSPPLPRAPPAPTLTSGRPCHHPPPPSPSAGRLGIFPPPSPSTLVPPAKPPRIRVRVLRVDEIDIPARGGLYYCTSTAVINDYIPVHSNYSYGYWYTCNLCAYTRVHACNIRDTL